MKKSDWLWALIVSAAVPVLPIALLGKGASKQPPELETPDYLDLSSAIEPSRKVWELSIDGERYVLPDGSVELPADLPVDDTAWRFWVALGNMWPDFREQMCAAEWGAK